MCIHYKSCSCLNSAQLISFFNYKWKQPSMPAKDEKLLPECFFTQPYANLRGKMPRCYRLSSAYPTEQTQSPAQPKSPQSQTVILTHMEQNAHSVQPSCHNREQCTVILASWGDKTQSSSIKKDSDFAQFFFFFIIMFYVLFLIRTH